jgi:AraC-like DNA-binding protein
MKLPLKLKEKDMKQLHQIASLITSSLEKHYTIAELAEKAGMQEKKLKNGFKQVYNMGLYAYLRHKRMERAKALMLEGKKIKDIIPCIGYHNTGNFSKAFRKVVKEWPSSWKNDQLGRTG